MRPCGSCGQELPILSNVFWEFTLALEPPTQNLVSGNKGSIKARKKYTKYRDDYVLVVQCWINELKIPKATGRRRVLITRIYSGQGKKRDRGNLVGGCKPLLDAMTRTGLIVDDREEFLEDHYYQRRGSVKGVEIRIEDME